MKIFNSRGMMIIPSPLKQKIPQGNTILVVTECFCPYGHNLIHQRVKFGQFAGIHLRIQQDDRLGSVYLSPIFGDKAKISLDLDLEEGEIVNTMCPECNAELPVYSACQCGGNLIALFTSLQFSFSDSIGVCNRIGCYNAQIKSADELLSESSFNA